METREERGRKKSKEERKGGRKENRREREGEAVKEETEQGWGSRRREGWGAINEGGKVAGKEGVIGVPAACGKERDFKGLNTPEGGHEWHWNNNCLSFSLSQFLTILLSSPLSLSSQFFLFFTFSTTVLIFSFSPIILLCCALTTSSLFRLSSLSCSSFSLSSDYCTLYFFTPQVKTHSLSHIVFSPFHSHSVAFYRSLLLTCSLLLCQHEKCPCCFVLLLQKHLFFPVPHLSFQLWFTNSVVSAPSCIYRLWKGKLSHRHSQTQTDNKNP